MTDQSSLLDNLAREIQGCQRCALAGTRNCAVPGEGNPEAEIMFIGEAPGFNEDNTGRPFCGAAGKFLTTLIESIGLKREDVFITNIIKSRPPGNRDPLPEEIEACKPWLDRQLEIIKPKVIVTLGRYSMNRFFPGKAISRIHGQWEKQGDLICFAMYHPAAALHQGNLRTTILADIAKLPIIIKELKQSEKPEPTQNRAAEPAVRQLDLFNF
ncbi:MAG: uracil-DNA glycosylase [Dehalogenimonas sp.]|jgi:DNA polymerase|uniref:Type-4 uracil-DNA glycosylase n=1 Tax=Candidatus Dehalogenimonas loeffleri TaxID=3127115 RepID=A0ABZ2J1G1_9CHLR|nr:uracil-DNA glycosylase [Dehalogenimonas sp.]